MMAKFDHIFEQLLQMGIKIKGKINTILSKTKQKKGKIFSSYIIFFGTTIIHIFILDSKELQWRPRY